MSSCEWRGLSSDILDNVCMLSMLMTISLNTNLKGRVLKTWLTGLDITLQTLNVHPFLSFYNGVRTDISFLARKLVILGNINDLYCRP